MSTDSNKLTNSAHQLGVMLGIPMYVDPEKGFSAEKVITWENGDKIKVNVIWSDGAFYYTANLGQIDPKTNEMSFISGEIANANSLESLIGMVDGFLKEKALERGDVQQAVDPDVSQPDETIPVENPEDVAAPADTGEEIPVDLPADVIAADVVEVPVDDTVADGEEGPVILSTVSDMGVVNSLPTDEVSSDVAVDIIPIDAENKEEAEEILKAYLDEYSKYQDLLLDPAHDRHEVYELSTKLAALESKLREQGINPTYVNKG